MYVRILNGWTVFKWVAVQGQVLVYTVISVKARKLAGKVSASQEGLYSMELVYILLLTLACKNYF
jgi:hypothetical protein